MSQPLLDEQGNPIHDKKGCIQPDKAKADPAIIPFNYEGGIEAFMDAEVRPYAPGAFIDPKGTKIGYELRFTMLFLQADAAAL